MDAHFAEYVVVVRAMEEAYGERPDGIPAELHTEPKQAEPADSATLEFEFLGV